MRIRWRGLELPSHVIRDEAVSTDSFGRFVIEPFEQGFGTTIGNSLRRVLLSSLGGAAVTSIKIEGVPHEFTSMEGVLQDVTDIVLNIKGVVFRHDGLEPVHASVTREQTGDVCAGDLELEANLSVVNPDHVIATLTTDVRFHLELTVNTGRGYVTGKENRHPDQEIGVIPMDSVFSPIRRVRFRTEDMRVGQRTNYDRLILDIWTDGSILPEDALVEAGVILRKHTNSIVMFREIGTDSVIPVEPTEEIIAPRSARDDEFLDQPISVLSLSVRANNCLEAARILTIRQLVELTENDLLRFRSFGKTSLHEVYRKLSDLGLSMGMSSKDGPFELPSPVPVEFKPNDPPEEQSSAATEGGPMQAFTMGEGFPT